ncbi:MAG TPA: DUF4349 domain-containing protein [Pyrinomonadaceae bacterium]|nr:DUF4349 domain-containing protein [Pyrinomonadaceae bacterium]
MLKARFIVVLFLAFLTACADRAGESSNSATNSGNFRTESVSSSNASRPKGGGGGGGDNEKELSITAQVPVNQAEVTQNQPVIERKIVRNADLNLEAVSPEESQQKISQIVESKQGFVVESQQSSSDSRVGVRDIVTMTVRVPAAKFTETLDEIRKTSSRVIVETIKSDDVTEEFIDVEARLKAKKSLEGQFLEIMKQAKTVEDALNVQRQLSEVRGEIEKIEGRKRFLENQTSLSTIKIRLQTAQAFSSNSKGFFSELAQSVGRGFDAALGFILGLVTFLIAILPFLLFVVLPIYLLLRYFWRKRGRRTSVTEIAKEELKTE